MSFLKINLLFTFFALLTGKPGHGDEEQEEDAGHVHGCLMEV